MQRGRAIQRSIVLSNDSEDDFTPTSEEHGIISSDDHNDSDFTPVSKENRITRSEINYSSFSDTVIINKDALDGINVLGAISKDPAYYFVDSELSREYAKDFLQAFWSTQKNIDLTLSNHNKRGTYFHTSQNNPSCIYFIAATINNKAYCLISYSGLKDLELAYTLRNFANDYNKKADTTAEFVILRGILTQFCHIVNRIKNDHANTKLNGCAELYAAFGLTKLNLAYGNKMVIDGAIACHLYPYSNTINKNIKYPGFSYRTIELNNGIRVLPVKCCESCRENKKAILQILKTAYDLGSEANETQTKRRDLSPLRNSITTHSTLLTDQSMFPRQSKRSSRKGNSTYQRHSLR